MLAWRQSNASAWIPVNASPNTDASSRRYPAQGGRGQLDDRRVGCLVRQDARQVVLVGAEVEVPVSAQAYEDRLPGGVYDVAVRHAGTGEPCGGGQRMTGLGSRQYT